MRAGAASPLTTLRACVFLIAWLLVWLRLWWPEVMGLDLAAWPEEGFLVLLTLLMLTWLARQLPAQNVLMVAAVIGGLVRTTALRVKLGGGPLPPRGFRGRRG